MQYIKFTIEIILSILFFVMSGLHFARRGPLLNNAYLYASPLERQTLDKVAYYKQSAMVFALLGIIYFLMAINQFLCLAWLFWMSMVLLIVTVVFAILTTVHLKSKANCKNE